MTAPVVPGQMGVVPAQLGFLAIFNPSLGATDDTIDEQIVYYASVSARSQRRRHRSRGKPTADISQEERNERLRQIGLAQGMVEFSRGFAHGKPVDTIETERTRVVLQEVEPGWWILASIDLTRIPLPPRLGSSTPGKSDDQPDNVEYSSRELKPSTLLMRDLLRAHSVFLLHHAPSLSGLFVKLKRSNFIKVLSRFWDLFLSTWDVMLHGNPASNIYGGIKVAACGELGVGVGEEDRGSGEREVLEGFVNRVEGLTDLVVSRFNPPRSTSEAEPVNDTKPSSSSQEWLGTGREPGPEDGAIFLGVGALSRKSLRDITYWMEDVYSWGDHAYGVKDSPASTRPARKRQKHAPLMKHDRASPPQPSDKIVSPRPGSSQGSDGAELAGLVRDGGAADEGGMNKLMSYLKMGYGTHWSLGGSEDETRLSVPAKAGDPPSTTGELTLHKPSGFPGHYLIGLLGDIDEALGDESERGSQPNPELEASEYNSRIPLRTLTVELEDEDQAEAKPSEDLDNPNTKLTSTASGNKDYTNTDSEFSSQDRNKTQKMRVVVYVNNPFIFTFIFQNRTDSLAWDGLYRSLHHQLAPLREPLLVSTAYRPNKPDVGEKASDLFDLVWDPNAMTIHSTIPNIPTPAEMLDENGKPVWSQAEAISTHNQILNMHAATLAESSELERTCKANRGWWVVWTRITERDPAQPLDSESDITSMPEDKDEQAPTSLQNSSQRSNASHSVGCAKQTVSKEIFIVRRAGEHTRFRGNSYAENGGDGWAEGAAGRLPQGIGLDTHRYIEGLLSLSR
ncbi:hypothetical protein F5Y14DRAFT_131215 [Nemania sp. NC0429]|nr:hypothetical protein F5Y14DRAFT_131215 [Nemania sp. NC0429]